MSIGQILAMSGQNVGSQLGNAYGGFGRDVGGMLSGISGNIRGKREEREAMQRLEQLKDDPQGLAKMAQQYGIQGNTKLATVFQNAATAATGQQEKTRLAAVGRGTGELLALAADPSFNINDPKQRSAYLGMADAFGVSRGDAMKIALEQRQKRMEAGKSETVSISPGGALVDKETGEVLYERPFKPEAAPASKGVKTVTRKDDSVSVIDADDGTLIATLPPPDKGEGDRDAALNLIAQTTSFIQDVDKLMNPGFFEEGLVGGVLQAIPGSDAYDREKELLSIRARLGFDQINEMKRLAAESGASGTGLGQISNIEFMSLQSTIDAIYVGMSGEAQNEALRAIKKHLLNVQKLASGVAPADAIEWDKPEYKAVGYHKDPQTGAVFYAPDGPSGTVYKLVDGKFVKLGAYLGSTRVE